MTQGVRIITLYKIIFFAINELKMSVTDIENLLPYELEIYQNLWVIERKKEAKNFEKNKSVQLRNKFNRRR